MFRDMGRVVLKSGEEVSMGVVVGPDVEWADRVEPLLQHKGQPWIWQNSALLRADTGVESYFYLLHRDGRPFANIMTVERRGVGIFGHVWTQPEDRRKSASTILMRAQMEDFRGRGGRGLFLQTEYDAAPFHIYRGFGFEGIEPMSPYMTWYAESEDAFEAEWFAKGPTVVEAPDWKHWPASPPLFMSAVPGVVRCAPLKLFGRATMESAFLNVLHEAAENANPRAVVLRSTETDAVAGLAAWGWDPLWPDTCLVDVFCHTHFWDRAPQLLTALTLPKTDRYVAYADPGCPSKAAALEATGFRQIAVLPRWLADDVTRSRFTDVAVWEKTR